MKGKKLFSFVITLSFVLLFSAACAQKTAPVGYQSTASNSIETPEKIPSVEPVVIEPSTPPDAIGPNLSESGDGFKFLTVEECESIYNKSGLSYLEDRAEMPLYAVCEIGHGADEKRVAYYFDLQFSFASYMQIDPDDDQAYMAMASNIREAKYFYLNDAGVILRDWYYSRDGGHPLDEADVLDMAFGLADDDPEGHRATADNTTIEPFNNGKVKGYVRRVSDVWSDDIDQFWIFVESPLGDACLAMIYREEVSTESAEDATEFFDAVISQLIESIRPFEEYNNR